MKPYQCLDPFDWQAILTLIQTEFAFMEGRIDPPSSMHRLTLGTISDHAQTGEIWAMGPTPIACVFLTPKPDVLYVGKLAVAASHRRHGLARILIELAATRARRCGYRCWSCKPGSNWSSPTAHREAETAKAHRG